MSEEVITFSSSNQEDGSEENRKYGERIGRNEKSEEEILPGSPIENLSMPIPQHHLCFFCGKNDNHGDDMLFPLPCKCSGYTHESCFEEQRLKYQSGCKNQAGPEILIRPNFFWTYSTHRAMHNDDLHEFLPYHHCHRCHSDFEVQPRIGIRSSWTPILIPYSIHGGCVLIGIFLFLLGIKLIYTVHWIWVIIFIFFAGLLGLILLGFSLQVGQNMYSKSLTKYFRCPKIGSYQKFRILKLDRTNEKFRIHDLGTCQDLLVPIFSFLPVSDIVHNISRTCRHFHTITTFPNVVVSSTDNESERNNVSLSMYYGQHNELWRRLYIRKFGEDERYLKLLESLRNSSFISFRDMYMEQLESGTTCQICNTSITFSQIFNNESLSNPCLGGCRGGFIHRHCLDIHRQETAVMFPVNVFEVIRSRCFCRDVDHDDNVHGFLRYRRCSVCMQTYELHKKSGKSTYFAFIMFLLTIIVGTVINLLVIYLTVHFLGLKWFVIVFGGLIGASCCCVCLYNKIVVAANRVEFFLFLGIIFVLLCCCFTFSIDWAGKGYNNRLVRIYEVQNQVVMEEEEEGEGEEEEELMDGVPHMYV